jgi:hypothetical protein
MKVHLRIGGVALPSPPPEMRALVGPTAESDSTTRPGAPVGSGLDEELFRSVLDFGCGCGARCPTVDPTASSAGALAWRRPAWGNDCVVHRGSCSAGTRLQASAPRRTVRGVQSGSGQTFVGSVPAGDSELNGDVPDPGLTHLTQDQAEFYRANRPRPGSRGRPRFDLVAL